MYGLDCFPTLLSLFRLTVSVFLVDLALVLRLVMVLGLLSELLPVFDKKVKKIIHIYQLMYHINIHDSKYGRLQL